MEIRINKTVLFALALIGVGIGLRLVPHADNFAPIGAIALFAGAILSWRIALWLPLTAIIASDLIIGLHDTVLFTWGGFALITLFAILLQHKSNWVRVPLGAVASTLIFFAVSNFGVWLVSGMYAHTWQGLADSYYMALPFLRNTFMSDLAFATVFFGLYALIAHKLQGDVRVRVFKPRTQQV